MLKKLPNPSVESISALLMKFCIRATITYDEDKELNKAGLSSSMPKWFDSNGDECKSNPLARYVQVELDKELSPLCDGMLWHEVDAKK